MQSCICSRSCVILYTTFTGSTLVDIGILGAGSWGIALATLLSRRGHNIAMWEFNSADAKMLGEKREHPAKLPGVRIPDFVAITNNVLDVFEHASMMLCVVPSQTLRSTAQLIAAHVPQKKIDSIEGWVIACKGIECTTLKLMNEVLLEEIPQLSSSKIAILSGPTHAEEVSRFIPTVITAASENFHLATLIQKEFSTETFRVYTNNDVTGVELASSVKNIIALAAGICDGLGFGDNTKGALLTRGMVEMVRLGKRIGADEQTFSGLAGMGDLITTCMSKHSRNRRMGELLGTGLSLDEALSKMTMVAEGVETTKSVYHLARKFDIDMPITTEVYKTLFEGKSAQLAVRDLMLRQAKPEKW
ncbi:MAG: NAD(P)H-dependent glycerol-3-phosphate dehydrogenase [Chitinivibrionales bacterium]|nr:NAD(P)H-dependent glycerol-3-phosphate dehydrogenase [Chitinivibrionales bacterium]